MRRQSRTGAGACSRFSALRSANSWPHEEAGRRGDVQERGGACVESGQQAVSERVASNNELYGIRSGASG